MVVGSHGGQIVLMTPILVRGGLVGDWAAAGGIELSRAGIPGCRRCSVGSVCTRDCWWGTVLARLKRGVLVMYRSS